MSMIEVSRPRRGPQVPSGTQPSALPQADSAAGPARRARWRSRLRPGRRVSESAQGRFAAHPHLLAFKPREAYVFRSDYFEVDDSAGCVLAFFHDEAAHDNFAAFWGIDRIPHELGEAVTAVVFEQVTRMGDRWIDQYVKQSERLDHLAAGEQATAGTASSRRRTAKKSADLSGIIAELQDGASYLSVHYRLLVKAPDLAALDEAVEKVARLYVDRFGTVSVAPYAGEQRAELSSLLGSNARKRGKGFHFSSIELAGSYSLVTNGLNDPAGEYVGYMTGDVNNSAVLLDVNGYGHHVVVADSAVNPVLGRAQVADMWASKISQAALLDGGRVVHLVLDGADLDRLGPRLEALTARVDMNAGEVNMFEMFGDPSDELSVFASQMHKLTLMFEQVYQATDTDRSVIRGELEKTATQFYIDQRMWHRNAKTQRDRLRVVGLPHEQVPRLQTFTAYLDTAHRALTMAEAKDPEQQHAYSVLRVVARNMLDNNGDLFNNHTSPAVDGVRDAHRVIYDFSKLLRRGRPIAMAQLVNIASFAVGKLAAGDVLVIHGAEYIDAGVKDYLRAQFQHLHQRGGRIAYCYNDAEAMLGDQGFNRFDSGDYTILGPMPARTFARYQEQLGQQSPPGLAHLVTARHHGLSWLRRGHTNVVFHTDLALGINPHRTPRRMREIAGQGKDL